jgi:aerobic carbon-monoxide dehydrogenase medium subunit
MKPGSFAYHDPRSLDDMLGLLSTLEDTKILAGGQSLMPMMNMRFVMPSHVIDINRVEGLSYIRRDGASLRIGAMTRQRELLKSDELRRAAPLAPRALSYVGHFQTRNRGTIGGSLCHLDPAAELPLVALLHDAVLTVRSASETREIPVSEWAMAYMMPSIAPEEALVEVALPTDAAWTGYSFHEFARRHGDFAIASAGCLIDVDDAGTIRRASIALGGVAQTPIRLTDIEAFLVGQPAKKATFAAARASAAKIDALSDAYFSKQYRQRLAGVLVERALAEASGIGGGERHG